MVVEEKELEEQTNEDVTPDNVNEADSKEAEPEEVELDTAAEETSASEVETAEEKPKKKSFLGKEKKEKANKLEEYESGIVAQELQKGYTYRDSVVRHSMVAVVQ